MILVTGASGFLGQHLVRQLSQERGVQVKALYHRNDPSEELIQLKGVQWEQCDLLDIYDVAHVMEGINEVYHCAAIVSFDPKKKNELLHFNVESTVNLVNEALESNIRKMVFVSSIAALGRSEKEGKMITEEEQWEESHQNSAYGQSKYAAELEVWRGIGEGLSAVIVNPGIILGEGDWTVGSANLMKMVHDGFPFFTNGVNGWVDVKDVVKAMITLMHSDVDAERFIVVEGNHTYKEVFEEMAAALNIKAPSIEAGKTMTRIAWRWATLQSAFSGKPVTITKETANTSLKKSFYDNNKLLNTIPSFQYTTLNKTINRMAAAFKNESSVKN